MAAYDLSVRDYWRIIKKRKVIIVFTFLAMTTFSFISSTLTRPMPIYRTSATIKFEQMQPFFQQGYGYGDYRGSLSNLDTQAAVIKSYFIMELVAKRLKLIPEEVSAEEIRNNPRYINTIMDLKGKVDTEQDGISNLINVVVTSSDSLFAKNLANTIVDVYREEHSREVNRKAIEEKKFIEGQRAHLLAKLHQAEEAVRDFREKNQRLVADPTGSGFISQLDRLVDEFNRKQEIHERSELILAMLKQAESRPMTADEIYYYEGMPSGFRTMAERLVQLLLQRDMLLQNYTEKFPRIAEIKNQIRELVAAMNSQLASGNRGLKNELAALQNRIEQTRAWIQQGPEAVLELARLERDRSIALEVYTLIEKRYQEALIAAVEKIEEVKIVKPALEQGIPINPTKVGANVTLGMIMGLVLGIVFAFLVETFDTSIGAVEEIEEFLGTRVLGMIPFLKLEDVRDSLSEGLPEGLDEHSIRRHFQLISHYMPTSTLAENYRALRTNFNFLMGEREAKVVVITSTYQGEGKTSVAGNLAIATAQLGHKVLLVDGDFRRPVIARAFGIASKPGFTDVILGNYKWQEVVRSMSDMMMGEMGIDEVTQTPGLENLFLVTSGTTADNPAELIGAKVVGEIVMQMRAAYDVVIIDAPPVLAATDATLWSARTDVVMIVYQVGKVARGALRRAKSQLDHVKASIIGIVLNGLKVELSPDFTTRDKYNYYYGYHHDRKKPAAMLDKLLSRLPAGLAGRIEALSDYLNGVAKPGGTELTRQPDARQTGGLWLKIFLLVAAVLLLAFGLWRQLR